MDDEYCLFTILLLFIILFCSDVTSQEVQKVYGK
ncbi:unnamed protein product [Schistosoma curassoni]|uniref:Uncharacterized protein n=1 Tax=Schistosoma curassoni TaxID=6186 RepID=A0A183JG42_9TREM|nr:unnamed protein product [Schistosoma curassoni]